jgi:hypothetical protein
MTRVKIFLLIMSFLCFCFGIVIIHVAINSGYYLVFLGMSFHRNLVFDIGIIAISVSFFILAYLSFKPIEVL